jgi:N-acetylneuraminate lyase/4-hydroxy-tetrahydrodipicolinate synthase
MKARELGCDGVVVAPPYYYPISQEMIEKYYETIIEAVDIPIVLYNIPLFSSPLDYDVVKRLSRRKNVVGIKESSGSMVDFVHFMDKTRLTGADIHFMTGREETFFACLMMGAKGCMAGTACILPEIMLEIYEAWRKGDYDRARKVQFSILLLVRSMFALPFPLGFKLSLEMRGFNMGPPKQPLSDAEQFKYRTVKSRIEKLIRPFLESLNNRAKIGSIAG